MTNVQKLADMMHKVDCHWNHTDGCSWFYETWEKPGHARKSYLGKAERAINVLGMEKAMAGLEVLQVMREFY